MKYIMRVWLGEFTSAYNVCCEVTSLFPGQLFCWYLLSLSRSCPAITPPHLCNFLWLPFTAQIWCTCKSPIKATCLVYLSPVSPGSLLLATTCLTAFSCYFMHCVWPYFFAFFSFFHFGKMRNPVKWEKSQLIWCSDISGYVEVEPCNTNTSSGETGPSSPAELRLAFMPT